METLSQLIMYAVNSFLFWKRIQLFKNTLKLNIVLGMSPYLIPCNVILASVTIAAVTFSDAQVSQQFFLIFFGFFFNLYSFFSEADVTSASVFFLLAALHKKISVDGHPVWSPYLLFCFHAFKCHCFSDAILRFTETNNICKLFISYLIVCARYICVCPVLYS